MENKKNTNVFAIIGFILSIISIFTFGFVSSVGLVLSILGLVFSAKYIKSLKGLSIAGIIISSIFFIVFWGIVFSSLSSGSESTTNTNTNTTNTINNSNTSNQVKLKDVVVIDFSTMSKNDIENWCNENSINCTFSTEYSDEVQADGFISQSVPANSTVKEKTSITIKYSLGHKKTAEEIAEEVKQSFKASCQNYSYDEISRNPDNYKGKPAVFRGEVAQVLESSYSSTINLRVNVTQGSYGWWDDTIYVTYTLPAGSSRILEKDVITMYGTLDGLYSYTAVLGNTITIPKLDAKYIEY